MANPTAFHKGTCLKLSLIKYDTVTYCLMVGSRLYSSRRALCRMGSAEVDWLYISSEQGSMISEGGLVDKRDSVAPD